MKVYVITSGEYSDYWVNAVALTKEKAERICAMLNGSNGYRSDTATFDEYDTDEIQCKTNEDVCLCYEAGFDYGTLKNIYWCKPFYSFARNEIERMPAINADPIRISATFPKDMPQEKVRKIMYDRVAKWKAEKECL